MRITVNGLPCDYVGAVTIGGSLSEIGRKAEFEIVRPGVGLAAPPTSLGSVVSIVEDGREVFYGTVWSRSVDDETAFTRVTCFDPMVYLSKSDVKSGAFAQKTPEEITATLAGEIGIPCGALASTGVKLNYNARGKTIYDAIKGAYAEASKVTGLPYYLLCTGRALSVIPKGAYSGAMLAYREDVSPGSLLSTNYAEELSELVSKVVVQDETKGEESVYYGATQYGIVQKVFQKENDKPAAVAARHLMYDIKTDARVQCIGDFALLSGYSCSVVSRNMTNFFYIDSDSHRYENGIHITDLTLNLKNEEGGKK